MKNIKIGCLFFVLAISLVSCAGRKPVVVQNTVTTEKTLTETVHDTAFKIEKDSSSYNALLDCINGKVTVKDVKRAEPGRTLKSPRVRIADNLLTVDCESKAQELFARWKSTYIKENRQEVVKVPVITNELTWWQKTQIKGFWVLAVICSLILAFIIATIIKSNLNKTT
ncbi:hypothetical protein [Flavobacterium gelatinilyticum]|uniref:hypothetical protein n=1 Tax=Flavobacterium gelatinilyticum TaxID=3003260 RepID=UPI0024815A91|nr:hypothetical protein [Flavobacterium gelatinilyticum]